MSKTEQRQALIEAARVDREGSLEDALRLLESPYANIRAYIVSGLRLRGFLEGVDAGANRKEVGSAAYDCTEGIIADPEYERALHDQGVGVTAGVQVQDERRQFRMVSVR